MHFLKDIETGEPRPCAAKPEWINGIWECGDWRMTDPTGTAFEAIEEAPPPTVGAIAFQRLFHIDERVKARELRATDLKLDDFWRQLEDPRTDVVVMALPSIQADIEYTLQAVKAAGLDIDVAERKAKILTGEVQ
jgi:hypothetical protein